MSLQNHLPGPPNPSRSLVFGVALVALSWSTIGTARAETWTSLRGTHSVEAKMVGLWDGNVILQLGDGRRVTVKMSDLRSESRIQAEALAKGIDSSRAVRVGELQGQATAAAAPAPDPLPKPPPAPDYVAPKKDATPIEFLEQVDAAIASGHILLAAFDALPPSYRSDVSEIVKLAADKLEPSTWQALVGTLQTMGDLMVTRQKWFLSSPRIQTLPPEQNRLVEGQVLTLAGLLREGLDPDAMRLEKLKTMDLRQWLAERDQAVAPYAAQLFEQSGPSPSRKITVESEKDGTAVVTIEKDERPSRVTYTQVEGYWVPKTIADGWAESVESWKKDLSEESGASFLDTYATVIEPISPMLEPLTQAGDAGDFHEAMEELFVSAEATATTIATMLGKSLNLASRGGPGGYGDYEDMGGYDADYEMEMQMQMEMEMQMEEEMSMEGQQ